MNNVEQIEISGVLLEVNHDILLEDGSPLIVELVERSDIIVTQQE